MRREYIPVDAILAEFKAFLSAKSQIDFLTLSGSGEPTLNTGIGTLLREIKSITSTPVAVITNSTLLGKRSVRKALEPADVILPSLDAGTEAAFQKINRPHPAHSLDPIVKGLKALRDEYPGQIWLETVLVEGINDTEREIEALKRRVDTIRPDKVQLNPVTRPPALEAVQSPSVKRLGEIGQLLGTRCEIVSDFKMRMPPIMPDTLHSNILSLLRRRPVTLSEMVRLLSTTREKARQALEQLEEEARITRISYKKKKYYHIEGEKPVSGLP